MSPAGNPPEIAEEGTDSEVTASEVTASEVTQVRAWAPASVGNLGCGLDVLGLALAGLGDLVVARQLARPGEQPGVTVRAIRGDGGVLPLDPARNTASIAGNALLRQRRGDVAVELEIEKGVPLAGGLGSSAASAVAAVVAVDALLGLGASKLELFRAAVEAEGVNCGAAHGDNVAPSLLGGCALVRPEPEPEAVALPCPAGLAVAILHPHVELTTRASRAVLPKAVPLANAIQQWANVGSLVAALHSGDLALLGRALEDRVSEPARGPLIPGFVRTQRAARVAGALGASLSGAGPSMFALCDGLASAETVTCAMEAAFREETGLECDAFATRVDLRGARTLTASEVVPAMRRQP